MNGMHPVGPPDFSAAESMRVTTTPHQVGKWHRSALLPERTFPEATEGRSAMCRYMGKGGAVNALWELS